MKNSYFDGGLFGLLFWRFVGLIITICTAGICYPWALTLIYAYEARHTVIDGHRLIFTGSAIGLFGSWIKWFLLTIITFGIYGFWVSIALRKWKTKHLQFAN